MLVGYVSDERYVALADVMLEFQRDGRTEAIVRSTPRGAIVAQLAPGDYHVTLVKDGFGSKSVNMTADPRQPYQFRLLSDCILGFVWPRAVKAGERSEFRVHAVEPYRLSLWRYGWRREMVRLLGWFDEHGPRAVMQMTPDGDYTQTGVHWNEIGYGSAYSQFVQAPERSGLYYFHAKGEKPAEFFSFPWIVAPAVPTAPIAVLASTNTWLASSKLTTGFSTAPTYTTVICLEKESCTSACTVARRVTRRTKSAPTRPQLPSCLPREPIRKVAEPNWPITKRPMAEPSSRQVRSPMSPACSSMTRYRASRTMCSQGFWLNKQLGRFSVK